MAHGVYLEAEYADGFIHREDDRDQSLYGNGNVFHDIINRLPEADHGKMVRFSADTGNEVHSIDWTTLPDNARPIYFRRMERETDVATGDSVTRALSHSFGYQFNDADGRNQQEVTEI